MVLAFGVQSDSPDPSTTRPTSRPATTRPATGGFNAKGSDPKAIEIADRVMEAMGGQDAWDRTRYLTWSFAGRRRHLWDRHEGRLRLEGRGPASGKTYVMLLNLNTGAGRAWQDGRPVTMAADLSSMLEAGEGAWINDSYWLLMPYKLKDTGVTLRSIGAGRTEKGREADVLELTFDDVGRTPANKYRVWVGKDSGLVEQWSVYPTAETAEPSFISPWEGWKRYGGILLSGGRGEMRGRPFELTDIAVFDELPDALFESPEPVDWSGLISHAGKD